MALTHIRRGDVVFSVDAIGSATHVVISTAQRAGSAFKEGHANSVHVAIATGNQAEVIESVGGGLKMRQLKPGNYRIYCYRGPMENEIREFSVEVAESHVAQSAMTPNYGRYNKFRATLCPFRLSAGATTTAQNSQFGAGGEASSSFFCSNFVWRCYTAAAEAAGLVQLPIPNSQSQISPRDLEGLIIGATNWHARNDGHSMAHP